MIYNLAHQRVALLVIDVQREYFDPTGPAFVPAASDVLAPINRLVREFRACDLPVIFVEHVHRADGSDVGRMADFGAPDTEDSFIDGTERVALLPALGVGPDDIVVRKRRYSSFLGTDLESILRTAETRAVVICGLMTSFCCETTARDAHGRDYEVLFVSDANAGPDLVAPDGSAVDHADVLRHTIVALSAGFAEVVSSDELIARLPR